MAQTLDINLLKQAHASVGLLKQSEGDDTDKTDSSGAPEGGFMQRLAAGAQSGAEAVSPYAGAVGTVLSKAKQKYEDPFSGSEKRQFGRMGLDPSRLQFLKTLAGFRKGMDLESSLLDDALGGVRRRVSSPIPEDLGQFA